MKLGYLIGVGVVIALAVVAFLMLHAAHEAPAQLGSPNGYEAFVPQNTINYNGNTDPIGDLILSNGTTIHNTIWNGQYSSTIIQNHDQIVQLNYQFVGQTDPVNNQPYVNLQDVYVVKGQVPIQQVTINGQPYYVIDADKINPANIAGFYTYQGWVPNFEVAINTPGTIPAVLPGNSPVYDWANVTGTVAYQTMRYGGYGAGPGGYVLVLPNKIIPYGIPFSPAGSAIPFDSPQQTYDLPS
ncbi:MAG: hypothetical protein RXN93_08945 [Thermocladium sp.]